jgi:predicted ArsR family transcriptional regulator
MARSMPAGYIQKALLYHLLEVGQASGKQLSKMAGVPTTSSDASFKYLVEHGLASRRSYMPGVGEPQDRSATYGITSKGAECAMQLKPQDGYPDGVPAEPI